MTLIWGLQEKNPALENKFAAVTSRAVSSECVWPCFQRFPLKHIVREIAGSSKGRGGGTCTGAPTPARTSTAPAPHRPHSTDSHTAHRPHSGRATPAEPRHNFLHLSLEKGRNLVTHAPTQLRLASPARTSRTSRTTRTRNRNRFPGWLTPPTSNTDKTARLAIRRLGGGIRFHVFTRHRFGLTH